MLVGHHDLRGRDRLAVLVFDGDLAFRVGPQCGFLAGMPCLRQKAEDAVRIVDRGRHEFRRLVAGITEHDALVAGTFILLLAGIDALRDVGRLRVQQDLDLHRFPVKAGLLVADVPDGLAGHGLDLFGRDR